MINSCLFKAVGTLLLAMMIFARPTLGQDAVFSQYYAAGLYLNPALAGVEPDMMLGLNYRSQWRSIVRPYTTMQASFIYPLYADNNMREKHFGGIGLSVFNDIAGDGNLRATGANLNLAYNLNITSKQSLGFGLQVGFIQKSLNPAEFQWGSQFDPFLGHNPNLGADPSNTNNLLNNTIYPDVSGGIMYYFNPQRDYMTKGFSGYIGVSGYHINEPDESLIQGANSTLPILLNGHMGIEFNVSPSINISPNILTAYQNGVYQFNGGAYFTYMFGEQSSVVGPTDIIFGGWYRLQDAYIALIGLGNDFYLIGFSYDVNSSTLRYSTRGRGAYEISLRLVKPHPEKKMRFHTPRI